MTRAPDRRRRFLRGHLALAFVMLATATSLAQAQAQPAALPTAAANSANVADWFVAIGTLVLAAVAIFQQTIQGWFYRPRFRVSIKTAPPDCVSAPFVAADGSPIADCFYFRLWVENVGNVTARNVEVYAQELRRQRVDGAWERVAEFPPMNLRWANMGTIYFPSIAPKMGKHCDVAHIVDPSKSAVMAAHFPAAPLPNQQVAMVFDLMVAPSHRGHIVGPGVYELKILTASDNARPESNIVTIDLKGPWHSDESKMLRDGVGINVA